MTPDEIIQEKRKLLKNNEDQDGDGVDELLNNQIHVLNSKTKRQELNNFIIRFSNFLTSVPVKIDL